MPHPDFQSIVQWVGPAIASGVGTAFNLATTTLIAPTTLISFRNLMIRASVISGADIGFVVTSYDSTTGLNVTGQATYYVRAGQQATLIVPVLGGAFSVSTFGSANGGALTWQAFGTNLDTGMTPNNPTNFLARRWPTNVAGFTTNSFQLAPYAGWARITALSQAANFTLYILQVDIVSGAEIGEPFRVPLPNPTTISVNVYIPPTLNIIGAENDSAGAADVFFAVMIAPQSRELY